MGKTRQCQHRIRLICVNDVYTFGAKDDDHGGWTRVTTLMRRLKRQEEDTSMPTTVLCTANGDVLGGAALLQHSKGHLAIDCLNAIPIDAAVVGNHEFDYGVEGFRDCLAASRFQWYGSNVIDKRTGEILEGVRDFDVLDIEDSGGLKLGIFGICTQATPHTSFPGEFVEFTDIEEVSKRVVQELKQHGAHVYIAVTHVSTHEDILVAKSAPELHLILGGHDHEPVAMQQNQTLIFKCGQNGYWVGVVDLTIDYQIDAETNEVVPQSVRVFPSWHMHTTYGVDPDPEVDEIIERHQKIADQKMLAQQKIGNDDEADELQQMQLDDVVATIIENPLDTRTNHVRRRETNSGNLLADAMLWHYTRCTPSNSECVYINDIDALALINGGFIRGDRVYPAGTKLLLRNILEELPFPRLSCLLEISGEHLLGAIEQHLQLAPEATGSFPHFSHNARLLYDVTAEVGKRVRKLSVNGQDVSPERKYHVILTDFVAGGGDGCDSWSHGTLKVLLDVRDKSISLLALAYLQAHNCIRPQLQSRVAVS